MREPKYQGIVDGIINLIGPLMDAAEDAQDFDSDASVQECCNEQNEILQVALAAVQHVASANGFGNILNPEEDYQELCELLQNRPDDRAHVKAMYGRG